VAEISSSNFSKAQASGYRAIPSALGARVCARVRHTARMPHRVLPSKQALRAFIQVFSQVMVDIQCMHGGKTPRVGYTGAAWANSRPSINMLAFCAIRARQGGMVRPMASAASR